MKAEGYSIKDLEILSGVKAHTIRIWEKRYKLLIPGRTDTNIRYYSDADLRRILNVSLLVNNGCKISKVAKWNDEQIKKTVLDISNTKTSESDLIDRLMLQILGFEYSAFNQLISEITAKMGLEDAVPKVFFKLLERIGSYWMTGSVFPAQEHFVSNLFRQKIISETDKLSAEQSRNSTILFFLREGERHELSLLYYAFLAKKNGYNVIYLGADVPVDDLAKMQSQTRIDHIFTAFIMPIPQEELKSYLFKLKEEFHIQRIFITGLQLKGYDLELPRLSKIIKDNSEFDKYLC